MMSSISSWRWLLHVAVVLWRSLAVENPEEYPNLLAGSFTNGQEFSTGNALPLIGLPWGFNHWAPQTKPVGRASNSWWFSGNDNVFTWLRCTHQPSPWIGDWGYFQFSPQIGPIHHSPEHYWQPRSATLKPYLLDAVVAPYNLRMELVPSMHGAILRVTFPEAREYGEKHICFINSAWKQHGEVGIKEGYYLEGESRQVTSDRMIVSNFGLKLRAESKEALGFSSVEDLLCFKYPRDASTVVVKMATSLISHDQAKLNLQREVLSKSFDELMTETKAVWNRLMKRINVLDAGVTSAASARNLIVFYTGLYRALTFPRRLDEIDADGNMVHYSPYDRLGRVFRGPLVTDNGLWDTYRTVYPLLSLAYPDHLGNIIQGWLHAYQEGGWLPSWASPGYRNCMVGSFADVVVADAIVKNIPCFDRKLAFDALKKDAFEETPRFAGGAVGKEGLAEYSRLGYLPVESGGEVVSRTLDYGFADYSTSLAFNKLSTSLAAKDSALAQELREKAEVLFRRSQRAYRSLFDKQRGFMVPKTSDHWIFDFRPDRWGSGYTEGNAWHHSFPAYAITCATIKSPQFLRRVDPFDCDGGLPALFGGNTAILNQLYALLRTPSTFDVGSYGQEIHEMTEMRALAMGQYGHNNQPAHHLLYLFTLLGDPRTTQRRVREVLQKAYGIDYYAGDEDNGEQGAWFVLSALGLYAVTPGTTAYVLGSPLFRHVRIARGGGDPNQPSSPFASCQGVNDAISSYPLPPWSSTEQWLDIFAVENRDSQVEVDVVTFNGSELTKPWVENDWLMGHGYLRFVMRGEAKTMPTEWLQRHQQSTSALEATVTQRETTANIEEVEKLREAFRNQQTLIKTLEADLAIINKDNSSFRSLDSQNGVSRVEMPSPWCHQLDLFLFSGLFLLALLTILLVLRTIWIMCVSHESSSASNRSLFFSGSDWRYVDGLVRSWYLHLRSYWNPNGKASSTADSLNAIPPYSTLPLTRVMGHSSETLTAYPSSKGNTLWPGKPLAHTV